MKRKEPLISIILKGFAIVAGLLALWRFVTAFVAPEFFVDGNAISHTSLYTTQGGAFVAAALSLWWMAELVVLLGRIAANTEDTRRGSP